MEIIDYLDFGLLIIILLILIALIIGIYWVYQRVLYYIGVWDDYVDEWYNDRAEFRAEYEHFNKQFEIILTNVNSIDSKLERI